MVTADTPFKKKVGTPGDQTKNVQFALDKGIPIVLRTFSVWSGTILLCLVEKWQEKLDNVILLVINSAFLSLLTRKDRNTCKGVAVFKKEVFQMQPFCQIVSCRIPASVRSCQDKQLIILGCLF